jgi:hypothetical protein
MIASFEVWLWKVMAGEARAIADRTYQTGLRRALLRIALDYDAQADASRSYGSNEPKE